MHHLHAYCSLNVLSRANIVSGNVIRANHHFWITLEAFSLRGNLGEVLNSTFFLIFIYLFVCLFLAVLGLRCHTRLFSCGEWGYSLLWRMGFSFAGFSCRHWASIVVARVLSSCSPEALEHRLRELWHMGFAVSGDASIFRDQGLTHVSWWPQADSLPPRKPRFHFLALLKVQISRT